MQQGERAFAPSPDPKGMAASARRGVKRRVRGALWARPQVGRFINLIFGVTNSRSNGRYKGYEKDIVKFDTRIFRRAVFEIVTSTSSRQLAGKRPRQMSGHFAGG